VRVEFQRRIRAKSAAHKPTTLHAMPRYILEENLISDPVGGPPFADISGDNILAEGAADASFFNWPASHGAPARRIFWSGWIGETPFALDHRTWTKDTWSRLERWCDAALPHLERRRATACFRPHVRHVLSDPQSCVSFLKRRAGQPFEILLDAAGFLTPSMLSRAEDHLRRAMDALAEHPGIAGVLITNVRATKSDADLLEASPVHEGLLAPSLVQLIIDSTPPAKPLITIGDAKLRP